MTPWFYDLGFANILPHSLLLGSKELILSELTGLSCYSVFAFFFFSEQKEKEIPKVDTLHTLCLSRVNDGVPVQTKAPLGLFYGPK